MAWVLGLVLGWVMLSMVVGIGFGKMFKVMGDR